MKYIFQSIAIGLFLIALWQGLVAVLSLPSYLLPGPILVGQSLWFNKWILLQQAWPTILEMVIGLGVAVLLGSVIAIAMLIWRSLAGVLMPIMVISQTIPVLAIAPLIVVWMGYGLNAKVLIIVITLFFPVAANFYDGLNATPKHWLSMAKVMQAKPYRVLWYIRIPAALPAWAAGVKIAAVWAPIGALVGEWVGSSQGLGFLMLQASARMDTALLFAAILMLVLCALLLHLCVKLSLRCVYG